MTPDPCLPAPVCADCGALYAVHVLGACPCMWPICDEAGWAHVQRTHRRPRTLLCRRHTTAEVVEAERFGRALVIERVPDLAGLLPRQGALL